MGVDSSNVASGRGRNSLRLSTKKIYNHGLVILDLAHMPGGACGTWPAFWMLGPNWPVNGEIDIIEGVNSQTNNAMTLHTNAGCSITSTGAFSGTMETSNCDVNAANQAANAGCSIDSTNSNSYGKGFNANGGGVYATEWTSNDISIWFFPRGSIPSDISSGNPNPSGWGLPQAQFTGGCDIDEHVKDQQLVFDVTFCGDWAGNVWSTDTTCASQGATCQAFVQNTPSAFQDTYWLINGLKVFTENGASPTQSVTTALGTATATATSTATSATATITYTATSFQPTATPSSSYSSPTYLPPSATNSFQTFTPSSAPSHTATFNTFTFSPSSATQPTTFVTIAPPSPSPASEVASTPSPTPATPSQQPSAAPSSSPSGNNNGNGNWGNWQGGGGGGRSGGHGGGGGGRFA